MGRKPIAKGKHMKKAKPNKKRKAAKKQRQDAAGCSSVEAMRVP